jgi:alpha-beta hydrolase superfamily lysophospholipase
MVFMKTGSINKRIVWVVRLAVRIVVLFIVVWITIIVAYAFQARKKDDLEIWHRAKLVNEFKCADYTEEFTLQEYLAKEDELFNELQTQVYDKIDKADKHRFNRYYLHSLSNPNKFEQNYNRSYELVPEEIRGGVLFIHGLTDCPYSMKDLAELFYDNGFYVLSLRMPGHGTIPAALTTVTHQDWATAVKVGSRHVSSMIGDGKPFYIAGFSNGALLTVNYALESIEDDRLKKPDRLFLFSPSIGVTKLAEMSKWLKMLGFIPYFEKSKWTEISPEYDPFKYTSFPLNASMQLYGLSKKVQKSLLDHHTKGTLCQLPPMVTFQSLIDSTVITKDIVNKLYDKLSENDHELVLFDVNRRAYLQNFLKSKHDQLLSELTKPGKKPYTLTIITNKDDSTVEIAARTKTQGSTDFNAQIGLDMAWPRNVYSLSHIAIVFPVDDPLYGLEPGNDTSLHLGNIGLKGERNLLKISAENLIRLRCNPFFGYITDSISERIELDGQ